MYRDALWEAGGKRVPNVGFRPGQVQALRSNAAAGDGDAEGDAESGSDADDAGDPSECPSGPQQGDFEAAGAAAGAPCSAGDLDAATAPCADGEATAASGEAPAVADETDGADGPEAVPSDQGSAHPIESADADEPNDAAGNGSGAEACDEQSVEVEVNAEPHATASAEVAFPEVGEEGGGGVGADAQAPRSGPNMDELLIATLCQVGSAQSPPRPDTLRAAAR